MSFSFLFLWKFNYCFAISSLVIELALFLTVSRKFWCNRGEEKLHKVARVGDEVTVDVIISVINYTVTLGTKNEGLCDARSGNLG